MKLMALFATLTAAGPDDPLPPRSPQQMRAVYVEALDDADGRDDALRGWVAARLVQEGYAVLPEPEAAAWRVTVVHDAAGWTVYVEGADDHRQQVAPTSDAVARLELLHRAVESLEVVEPLQPANDLGAPAALGMEISGKVSEQTRADMETEVVLGALSHGLALAGANTRTDQRVCVEADDADRLRVAIGEATTACADVLADEEAIGRAQLRARLSELLAPAAAPEPSSEREPEPKPEPAAPTMPAIDDEDAPTTVSEPKPRRKIVGGPPAVHVQGRVGVLGRLLAPDALIGARVRVGRDPGIGGRFTFEVWPSRDDEIRVVEVVPTLGLDGRLAVSERVVLDLGIDLGLLIHTFDVPIANTQGTRVDFVASVPLGVAFRVVKGLELSFSIRGGRASRARFHQINGDTIWSRDAWIVGGNVGVAYGWRLR